MRTHELQHARLRCPSPTPGACSNSYPSSWRCHPNISSSVIPFSCAFNIFQHQGLFQWVSSSHQWPNCWSFCFNIRSRCLWWIILDSFPLGLTGLISLRSKGLSRVFSNITVQKQVLRCSAFFMVRLSYPYMTAGKTTAWIRQTFVSKVMSLLFNMLSRLVIAFLPRSKRLWIS